MTRNEMAMWLDTVQDVVPLNYRGTLRVIAAELRGTEPAAAGPKRCVEGPCKHFDQSDYSCTLHKMYVPSDGSGFCHLHSELHK